MVDVLTEYDGVVTLWHARPEWRHRIFGRTTTTVYGHGSISSVDRYIENDGVQACTGERKWKSNRENDLVCKFCARTTFYSLVGPSCVLYRENTSIRNIIKSCMCVCVCEYSFRKYNFFFIHVKIITCTISNFFALFPKVLIIIYYIK